MVLTMLDPTIIFNELNELKEIKMRELTKEELEALIKNEVNKMSRDAFVDGKTHVSITTQRECAQAILDYCVEWEALEPVNIYD